MLSFPLTLPILWYFLFLLILLFLTTMYVPQVLSDDNMRREDNILSNINDAVCIWQKHQCLYSSCLVIVFSPHSLYIRIPVRHTCGHWPGIGKCTGQMFNLNFITWCLLLLITLWLRSFQKAFNWQETNVPGQSRPLRHLLNLSW